MKSPEILKMSSPTAFQVSLAAGCHLPDYTKGSAREGPAPIAHKEYDSVALVSPGRARHEEILYW